MLPNGTIVAGYRLDGLLGRGAMGVVYEATQLSLDRTVALKLIAPDRSDSDALRKRFRLEGLRQSAIDHPHIVTVHEAGETEHGLYFAMTLVRGPTLKELIAAGQLDTSRTLRLLSQVADALDSAHDAGLIHRDVKPHNILVGRRDHAYLADFGLTKAIGDESLTQSGKFVGTLHYVAPEQIRGEHVTAHTDVYALGAVLYECLTGLAPYREDSQAAILWAHLAHAAPLVSEHRPDLPRTLDAVIRQAMDKRPEARFASASDLLCSAEASLADGPRAPAHGGLARDEPRSALDADHSTVDAGRAPVRAPAPGQPSPAEAGTPRTAARPARLGLPARRRVAAAALLAAALAAAAGYVTGASPATRSLRAGALRLDVPDDWRRVSPAPKIPGLALSSPAAVAVDDDPGTRLLVGMADGSGVTLLPEAFLARLSRPPATDDVVKLGTLEAYRYRHLRPSGLRGRLTLFVVPTDERVATIACLAGAPADPSAACERVAATLRLDRLRALPPGPRDAYAKGLNAVLGRLDALRTRARRALRASTATSARARRADELSRAFRQAEAGLATVPAGPAERPAHEAMRADARRVAAAYDRLATAARRRSVSGYRAAGTAVRAGEARLDRDRRALASLGYSVR